MPRRHRLRVQELVKTIERVFKFFGGDDGAALDWLTSGNEDFYGRTPLEVARTEAGRREIEVIMERLDHGVYF